VAVNKQHGDQTLPYGTTPAACNAKAFSKRMPKR
jgi:hypothetical protein